MFGKQKHQESGLEIVGKNPMLNRDKLTISPILNLLQIALSLLGVYGSIFSFLTGLGILISQWFFPGLILIVIYFNILYRFNKYLKYTLPVTFLLYLTFLYLNWDKFKNGFWHVENYVIDALNNYYGLNLLKYLVDGYVKEEVVSLFLLFITVIIAFLITGCIYGKGIKPLFILLTLPLAVTALFVGTIPPVRPFGAYLVSAISIVGMNLSIQEKRRKLKDKKKDDVTKEQKYNEKRLNYLVRLKTGGFIAAAVMLLMLVIPLVFTQKSYQKKVDVTELKEKLQKGMMELNMQEVIQNIDLSAFKDVQLFGNVAFGGLSAGKLGRVGEVRFTNKTAIKLKTAPIGETIYLKGYVGSNYTKNAWEGLSKFQLSEYEEIAKQWEDSGFSIGNQSSYYMSLLEKINPKAYSILSFYNTVMDVTSVNSSRNYIYAPYHTVYAKNMDINNPEYVTSYKKQKEYIFSYYGNYKDIYRYDNKRADLISDIYYGREDTLTEEEKQAFIELKKYKEYEAKYRDFVINTYTAVPEESLMKLKEYVQEYRDKNGEDNGRISGNEKIINIVRQMVQEDTVYSLSPGVLPKGEDFIEYFLFENKTGYCAHYASAATILFRMFGVPARYVEGYVVKPQNIIKGKVIGKEKIMAYIEGQRKEIITNRKEIQITDANAHSWVEIYITGFGWVPVEVTPGFNRESGAPDFQRETETMVTPTATPIPTKTVTPTKVPEKENKNNQKEIIEVEKKYKTDIEKIPDFVLAMISIIGAITILAAGVIARERYLYYKRNGRIKCANGSERTLILYQEVLKVLAFLKIQEQDEIQQIGKNLEKCLPDIKEGEYLRYMEVVKKAKFGRSCITEEEAFISDEFYNKLLCAIYLKANLVTKLYLKYIKAVLIR